MSSAPQVTLREIAVAVGLVKSSVVRRAAKEDWQYFEKTNRGGRVRCYMIDQLPPDIQEEVLAHQVLKTRDLPVPAQPALPAITQPTVSAPSTLTEWQRQALDARCAILHLVDDLAKETNVTRAVEKVTAMAQAGTLPQHIQALVPVANACGEKLSTTTLFRWRSIRKKLGINALAPKDQNPPVPEWAPFFLQLHRHPQKPSVADVLERLPELLPKGMSMPSQAQCYRLLKKMSAVDREKGRRTGNELRSIMPYRQRSTDELLPLDIVTCDGHTFKARIAHPFHGKPFQPEVCACVDVVTRKALGWSAGLSESASTVADALRHAIQCAGIPAEFYTDPGSGNMANVNAHESYGRYMRLGITFTTGLPGRTQARGLIERFQKSCWIRAAKELPTYVGKDMDGTVLYKMTRLIESEVRKTGSSDKVMSWRTFTDSFLPAAFNAYNNREHTSLPKIVDASGRKRHMTPNEYWEWWIAKGWQPLLLSDEQLADMWRPRVQCMTYRAQVRLFNNIYYHGDLQHYHGSQVLVEYEPQDADFVWIRDLDGRLVCRAKWNGNKSSYRPISAIEAAREKRADARMKLIERKAEEIELERRGSTVIDVQPDPEITEAARRFEEKIRLELAAPKEPEFPEHSVGQYERWKYYDGIKKEGGTLSEEQESFYRGFRNGPSWATLSKLERDFEEANARRDEPGTEPV